MENLRQILEYAPRTRKSVTAARLERLLNEAQLDTQDTLTALCWLVACRPASPLPDGTQRALNHCQEQELNTLQRQRLNALHARTAPQAGRPAAPERASSADFRWLSLWRDTGQEMEYPVTVRDVFVSEAAGKSHVLGLRLACVCCGESFFCTTSCDVLPWGEEHGSWLCPHCLARGQWSTRALRHELWAWYTQWFTSLSKDAHGLLEQHDADKAVVLAHFLRPWAPIRFCILRQDRIGHSCYALLTISEQLQGLAQFSLDFYGIDPRASICNSFFLELWNRVLDFTPAAAQLYHLALSFGMEDITRFVQTPSYPQSLSYRHPYPLPFTLKEAQRGMQELERMGIPLGARIACLFVRDSAYLNNAHPLSSDQGNEYRNTSIEHYHEACQELERRGWYVLRMGAAVEQPLTWTSSHIIDYATQYRTEFMDIWLMAHADLCISNGSGLDALCFAANRPLLLVNAVDLWYIWELPEKSLVLPKRMHRLADGSPLSLQEYLRHHATFKACCRKPKVLGYTENTSQELLDATVEMLDMLEGKLCDSPPVQKLQAHYRNLTKGLYEPDYPPTRARFCTQLLLQEAQQAGGGLGE